MAQASPRETRQKPIDPVQANIWRVLFELAEKHDRAIAQERAAQAAEQSLTTQEGEPN